MEMAIFHFALEKTVGILMATKPRGIKAHFDVFSDLFYIFTWGDWCQEQTLSHFGGENLMEKCQTIYEKKNLYAN